MTDGVLPSRFVIGKKEYDKNLEEELFVNGGDLSGDYADHSRRFAWFATAVELCTDVEARLKVELGRAEAVLDAVIREEAAEAGIKMTETKVKNAIITRDVYKEIQEDYLQAKLNTGLAKAARDAMIHRKDMLISLGANYRAEGNSDISLKTDQLKNK